jgi:hypothetical protein
MTLLIIFLLSSLSTYLTLKLITILLDTTLNDLLWSDDDIYVAYQTFMTIAMTLVFFMTYCAINNTFLHFNY